MTMIRLKRAFDQFDSQEHDHIWIKPNLIAGIEPLGSKYEALNRQGKSSVDDDIKKPACVVSMAHCYLPDLYVEHTAEDVLRMRDEALGIAAQDKPHG